MCSEKLRLTKTKMNSGYAGVPRNIGIGLSCGKYISFVDSDDMITKTALEELYSIAEKFNADVVHCEKYYRMPKDLKANENDNLQVAYHNISKFVSKPTLISADADERVSGLRDLQFMWSLCMKLIRRDCIIENDIRMIQAPGEDMIFTTCLVCCAKRYVRVPNICYIYRIVDTSTYHRQETLRSISSKWLPSLIQGFNYMDKFLDGYEFFKNNTDAKYIVLEVVVREFVAYFLNIYSQIPAHQLDDIIRDEFAKAKDTKALSAFMFGRMNVFNVNLIQQSRVIQQLQAQLQQQSQ